jgi:hypothetical protein
MGVFSAMESSIGVLSLQLKIFLNDNEFPKAWATFVRLRKIERDVG